MGWFVLRTESGARWAMSRAETAIPGDASFAEVSGTFWSGLEIGQFEIREDSWVLLLTDARVQIDWSATSLRRISIRSLSADTVRYESLTESNEPPEPLDFQLPAMPIALVVNGGRVEQFQLASPNSELLVADISIDEFVWDDSALRARMVEARYGNVAIDVNDLESETSEGVPVSANIAWTIVDDDWSGQGPVDGTLAALHFEHSVDGPYPVTGRGTVEVLNQVQPQIELLAEFQQWQFDGLILSNGELSVTGDINDYTGTLNVAVSSNGLSTDISGDLRGTAESLSSFSMTLDGDAGDADVQGTLTWTPEFALIANVDARNFDPTLLSARLSGNLNATAGIDVAGTERLNLNNLVIEGTLNDAPLQATAELARNSGVVTCSDCEIELGESTVSFNGQYGNGRGTMDILADIARLDRFWPAIGGSLNVDGTVSGSPGAPEFTGQLSGQQLRFGQWAATSIELDSKGSSADNADLSVVIGELSFDQKEFGSIAATANGDVDAFSLEAQGEFQNTIVSTNADIERSANSTLASVRTASIRDETVGSWVLDDQFTVEVADQSLTVSSHRWTGPGGSARIGPIEQDGDELIAQAELQNLPLDMFNPFTPPGYNLAGVADAQVNVTRNNSGWRGNIDWQQKDTLLQVTGARLSTDNVEFPRVELQVDIVDDSATINGIIEVDAAVTSGGGNRGVTGELTGTVASLTNDPQLNADLTVSGEDWNWLATIVPTIDDIEGEIGANLSARGPITSPGFSGDVAWKNGGIVLPSLNVPLTDIDLVVAGASDGRATLNGSAKAGEGTLVFDGEFNELMQSSRSLRMTVTGETAEVVNWPEYRIWASPDIEITGNTDGWNISGNATIPKASVEVEELPPEAVKVSADVTVVGAEEDDEDNALPLSAQVQLGIGDQVRVQAFGLDTRLTGSLRVRRTKSSNELRADGRVNLEDGVFEAYGQKLTIESGTLLFTGPLDNPIVDVRAVRVIDEFGDTVTAGIHLQGRANSLRSSVYAEPATSEANALSYLLLGRPLEDASDAEGGQLSNAGVALGLRQATRITQQIGQNLGLDQLSFSGDGGDATALVAGKQINSRLYARYAYGVFSRLGMIMLRYRLSQRLSLEAGAGENQSIDLIYTVEKE